MVQVGCLPVSLANIIGGPECASAKWRVRGYLVLLNRCRTMQIKPASTAIPVVTPRRVGRSEPMRDKSGKEFRPHKAVCDIINRRIGLPAVQKVRLVGFECVTT